MTKDTVVSILRERRKWYGESMFPPIKEGETQKVHERWPGLVDRVSAEMARHTIDHLLAEIEELADEQISR